ASAKASSWMIARAVKTVLDPLDGGEDPIPAELRERHGLAGRAEAIRAIHRPLDQADLKRARERLKWDEAFLLQAALAQRRLAAAAMPARPRTPPGWPCSPDRAGRPPGGRRCPTCSPATPGS